MKYVNEVFMILVTGGAGYIGSHCVLSLIELGYDVVIFDSLETGHIEIIDTLKCVNTSGKIIDFIQGDLKNFNEINRIFEKYSIDTVVHFAAFSQVFESILNPQKYYQNNIIGSLNLFNAMVNNNVKKLVFSSSAAIYGEPKYIPIDENHSKEPINPYGMSKLMIENILDDYNKAYELRSVRLRYFNVVGADRKIRIGEWHEPETHLIPNILKSALINDKVFEIYGNDYDTPDGTCIRDYINIDDLINAHILSIKYLKKGGETDWFNLGTSGGNSVKQVFDLCKSITEKNICVKLKDRRIGDPKILIADNKKAKDILNWTPKNDLRVSIDSAYKWEKKIKKTEK